MATTKSFKGTNVFMSRNLVPPELFDTLHDALKQNGAEVLLCCDPSRTGPNDYHIISSLDHEKFNDLRSKGCNLLGPECVFSCAKEHRILPKQGFTCCLAMDGVKVLASGFDMDEKVKIEKLVTAMGGAFQTKVSSDVNFVIVKNVLAAKYKWASNSLKKPVVTIKWLYQCWNEHRLAPHESHRVLPLDGLTISVTGIPIDERREMEKLIIQNGGKYSAVLTKKSTHLICEAPEGDKYKAARTWGHIYIVSRRWLDQSLARRACLKEESYPVQGRCVSSINKVKAPLTAQHYQDRVFGASQSAASSVPPDSNMQTFSCDEVTDQDLVSNLSQRIPSNSDSSKDVHGEVSVQNINEMNCEGCVADNSQTEENDLYLSDCRILLIGFEASDMRKLVNLVRKGGGSRYMALNEKLTHIVVGTPSEMEKKELRSVAALGIIKAVNSTWLEECARVKKEIPVLHKHAAHDLFLVKDQVCLGKGAEAGPAGIKQGKVSTMPSGIHSNHFVESTCSGSGILLGKDRVVTPEVNIDVHNSTKRMDNSAANENGTQHKMRRDTCTQSNEDLEVSGVFKGKRFCFSSSFADERRPEIVEWVNMGEGEVVDGISEPRVDFIIECHGLFSISAADVNGAIYVSSHWIRSSLKGKCLLDVDSHVLYSPLPCRVPLPRFESFRFCVSQYEDKEKVLLRNLCYVLGAKYSEKLTRKVTHLLCKFRSGPKYDAACKWGTQTATSEWVYACVRQNQIAPLEPYHPREASTQDREAGLCNNSQYPSQTIQALSSGNPFQFSSQSQSHKTISQNKTYISNCAREETKSSNICSKKARVLEDCSEQECLPPVTHQAYPLYEVHGVGNDKQNSSNTNVGLSHTAPDVASAIEDLLEQTSKIQDCANIGLDHSQEQSTFGISDHWSPSIERKHDKTNAGEATKNIYDNFSETQTEDQVVGYEEDLSGRQMIIDRVRKRSSMT